MHVDEAKQILSERYHHIEQDSRYLYVRTAPNSVPVKLKISWLGTVSDLKVKQLENQARRKPC